MPRSGRTSSSTTRPATAARPHRPGRPDRCSPASPTASASPATDIRRGTASAAYRVEGARKADGKGPSVRDVFIREPGRIFMGSNGDVAVDHFHQFLRRLRRDGLFWSRDLIACHGEILP
ncbi:family 1 glycosylhydrolase [Jeongeupia naejangsanensis]|uniref:family 1 glycosylhydrolase n=1 Tax=Jeongeupia naejangsanensis TaxID=613195 RepID=UPI0023B238E0|nr:family 1 glycosylhydrolase [Jeongeupia naejangsanensis]